MGYTRVALAALLMLLGVGMARAQPVASLAPGAASFGFLKDWVGKDLNPVLPSNPGGGRPRPGLLDDPRVASTLTRTLGQQRFSSLRTGWGAGFPLIQEAVLAAPQTFAFFACKQHFCASNNVAVFIGMADGRAIACWEDEDRAGWLVAEAAPRRMAEGACSGEHDLRKLFAAFERAAPQQPPAGARLAYSQKLGLEVLAASRGNWCVPQVELRVAVTNPAVFADPELLDTLQRLGQRVVAPECAKAGEVAFAGVVPPSATVVWHARATARANWRPERDVTERADAGSAPDSVPDAAARPRPARVGEAADARPVTAAAATKAADDDQEVTVAHAKPAGSREVRAISPGNIAGLDIAGLRLEMAPSQVRSALESFDPDLRITDGLARSAARLAYPGAASEPDAGEDWPGLLFSVTASKHTEAVDDMVIVWFRPVADQGRDGERVVAISRRKTYITSLPTVASLWQSATEKYGRAASSDNRKEGGGEGNLQWVYSRTGGLLSPQVAGTLAGQPGRIGVAPWSAPVAMTLPPGTNTPERFAQALSADMANRIASRGRGPFDGFGNVRMPSPMPGEISSQGGVSVQMSIAPDTNPLLAKGFSMLLMDQHAFFDAYETARAVIVAAKQAQKDARNKATAQSAARGDKL